MTNGDSNVNTLWNNVMINKPQKTIHISFNEEDEDLYFHIMRQTSPRTLIPVATYCRFLMKEGIKNLTDLPYV